jgi:hypothetical protein
MRADAPFRAGNARGTIWTPARVKHEFEILSHVHFFRILTHGLTNGVFQILGVLSFTQEETGRIYSLKVRLEYPRDYPWAVPSVFDQDKQFRPSANGHQFPDHRLCLSFPEREEFGIGSEQLSSEVLGASLIWLDKRYIFERNGKWPGEAEEHGWARPLRRLLKEEARRSRNGYLSAWTDWIIAELATPQFHMGCPCCSGKRFLDCHWRLAMLSAQYLFSMQYERGLDEHRSALEAA